MAENSNTGHHRSGQRRMMKRETTYSNRKDIANFFTEPFSAVFNYLRKNPNRSSRALPSAPEKDLVSGENQIKQGPPVKPKRTHVIKAQQHYEDPSALPFKETTKDDGGIIANVQLTETSPPPPLRESLCAFLFVGLDSAGISSTLATTLNVPKNLDGIYNNGMEISETKFILASPSLNLKIIDVPGFDKGQYIEQDAELSLALKSHLKVSLPNQIPTVIFVVTRFDDNRFQGGSSAFSKMLKALSHSLQYSTDPKCSNVILLLTHCNNILLNEDEMSERVSAFRDTFHTVFEKIDGHTVQCITVDNLQHRDESHSRIYEAIAKKVKKAHGKQSALKDFMQNFTADSVNWKNLDTEKHEIQSLLPPYRREVNQLLALLLDGVAFRELPQSVDIDDLDYSVTCADTPEEPGKLYLDATWLPHDSDITLADGKTTHPVSQLCTGDKLMDKDGHPVIVTSITTKPYSDNMTKYYVTFKEAGVPPKFLQYFGPSKIKKVVRNPNEMDYANKCHDKTFYCSLALNNGLKKETFIADKFVMYSNNCNNDKDT